MQPQTNTTHSKKTRVPSMYPIVKRKPGPECRAIYAGKLDGPEATPLKSEKSVEDSILKILNAGSDWKRDSLTPIITPAQLFPAVASLRNRGYISLGYNEAGEATIAITHIGRAYLGRQ